MPVSALMAIIHTLFSDNKRNSIICDPWLGHCSLGILKKKSVTNQKGIGETLFHSVIHLLIFPVSQSVNKSVREACALGIDFWIRSEKEYRKPHINPPPLRPAIAFKLLKFNSAFMFYSIPFSQFLPKKSNNNNNKVSEL